jgi:peptide/nickel transport system permease protein
LLKFLAVRIASVVGVVVMVTAVTWVMIHTLRPEPWAFDQRPAVEQFLDYLNRAFLHADLGNSWEGGGRPVATLMREGISQDLWLLGGGMALGLLAGMAAGTFCAARPRTLLARSLESLASIFICAPPYVVGLGVLLLFGAGIAIVDVGIGIPVQHVPMSDSVGGWLGSMIVPWIVLSLPFGAFCLRMMSGSMKEVLHEQYLRTAAAKGLDERTILRRHAAPAAAAPVFSLAGVTIPLLVTNMVIIEHVFSIPGVFQDMTNEMDDGNFPVIQGMTLVAAFLVGLSSLIVDTALARLDPVVRAGGSRV